MSELMPANGTPEAAPNRAQRTRLGSLFGFRVGRIPQAILKDCLAQQALDELVRDGFAGSLTLAWLIVTAKCDHKAAILPAPEDLERFADKFDALADVAEEISLHPLLRDEGNLTVPARRRATDLRKRALVVGKMRQRIRYSEQNFFLLTLLWKVERVTGRPHYAQVATLASVALGRDIDPDNLKTMYNRLKKLRFSLRP